MVPDMVALNLHGAISEYLQKDRRHGRHLNFEHYAAVLC
jgi:hypothetical protein